jgi:hypothetical protein
MCTVPLNVYEYLLKVHGENCQTADAVDAINLLEQKNNQDCTFSAVYQFFWCIFQDLFMDRRRSLAIKSAVLYKY